MLCMGAANERWHYNVTSSPIGWADTEIDPCNYLQVYWHSSTHLHLTMIKMDLRKFINGKIGIIFQYFYKFQSFYVQLLSLFMIDLPQKTPHITYRIPAVTIATIHKATLSWCCPNRGLLGPNSGPKRWFTGPNLQTLIVIEAKWHVTEICLSKLWHHSFR